MSVLTPSLVRSLRSSCEGASRADGTAWAKASGGSKLSVFRELEGGLGKRTGGDGSSGCGREAWRRIRRRVVRFVEGSFGCHGREKGLRGQAGRRLQTSRQEVMEAETNAFGEEGPRCLGAGPGGQRALPPTVGPSVAPTGDPDPHLRFGGDARVV